jgi:glyoxylase-like metal-dependent hydrolase (beta-lactamase superfamily II)
MAIFLVRGSQASVIFESGVPASSPVVLNQLEALGVPREEVAWVVVSHAHSDHATGQAALLSGLPRAQLLLSEGAARHLGKPETAQDFADQGRFTSQAMLRHQNPAPGPIPSPFPLLPASFQVTGPGRSLDWSGPKLRFLDARGHAPGGLLAWLPDEGVFLASDSAGFYMAGRPNYPLCFVSFNDYLENLGRIRRLGPQALALGHQIWFQDGQVPAYLDGLEQHLLDEQKNLKRQASQGQSLDQMGEYLMERYYHDELAIYPPQSMLKNSKLLVRRFLEE